MNEEKYEIISEYIHGLANAIIPIQREFGRDLRHVAELVLQLPRAMPTEGQCPYCRAKFLWGHWHPQMRGAEGIQVSRMRVIHRLCDKDQEYQAGYRTIWRCDGCGELEMR